MDDIHRKIVHSFYQPLLQWHQIMVIKFENWLLFKLCALIMKWSLNSIDYLLPAIDILYYLDIYLQNKSEASREVTPVYKMAR
jgi:hypothetical protein